MKKINQTDTVLLPAKSKIQEPYRVIWLVLHNMHIYALRLGKVIQHHERTAGALSKNEVK